VTLDEPASVLTRDGAALHDVRESWHDGHNLQRVYGAGYVTRSGDPVRLATDAERAAAAADLGAVIEALASLHAEQATRYREAARTIVRATPR